MKTKTSYHRIKADNSTRAAALAHPEYWSYSMGSILGAVVSLDREIREASLHPDGYMVLEYKGHPCNVAVTGCEGDYTLHIEAGFPQSTRLELAKKLKECLTQPYDPA